MGVVVVFVVPVVVVVVPEAGLVAVVVPDVVVVVPETGLVAVVVPDVVVVVPEAGFVATGVPVEVPEPVVVVVPDVFGAVVVEPPVVAVAPDPVVVVVPEPVAVEVPEPVVVGPELMEPPLVVLTTPGLFLMVSFQSLWCLKVSVLMVVVLSGAGCSSFLHDVMAINAIITIPSRDQTCLRHGFRAVTFILGSLINYWARIRP